MILYFILYTVLYILYFIFYLCTLHYTSNVMFHTAPNKFECVNLTSCLLRANDADTSDAEEEEKEEASEKMGIGI